MRRSSAASGQAPITRWRSIFPKANTSRGLLLRKSGVDPQKQGRNGFPVRPCQPRPDGQEVTRPCSVDLVGARCQAMAAFMTRLRPRSARSPPGRACHFLSAHRHDMLSAKSPVGHEACCRNRLRFVLLASSSHGGPALPTGTLMKPCARRQSSFVLPCLHGRHRGRRLRASPGCRHEAGGRGRAAFVRVRAGRHAAAKYRRRSRRRAACAQAHSGGPTGRPVVASSIPSGWQEIIRSCWTLRHARSDRPSSAMCAVRPPRWPGAGGVETSLRYPNARGNDFADRRRRCCNHGLPHRNMGVATMKPAPRMVVISLFLLEKL